MMDVLKQCFHNSIVRFPGEAGGEWQTIKAVRQVEGVVEGDGWASGYDVGGQQTAGMSRHPTPADTQRVQALHIIVTVAAPFQTNNQN